MSQKIYYVVYKTTNKTNKRIYIGIHKQIGNEFDGYLGSGKALLQSVKKTGKDNFIRETLYSYVNKYSALNKERELVNEEFIKKRSNYNLCVGGLGYNISPEIRARQEATKIAKYGNKMGQCHTKESLEKGWKTKEEKFGNKCGMLHTPEAFHKSRETFKNRYGSFISVMKSDESLKKRSEKLRSNYINRKPELLDICIMYNPNGEIILEDTIFNLSKYMTDKSGYIVNPRIILNRYKSGDLVKQGPWKGYKFIAK
jgi:hypothetical protein